VSSDTVFIFSGWFFIFAGAVVAGKRVSCNGAGGSRCSSSCAPERPRRISSNDDPTRSCTLLAAGGGISIIRSC